MTLILKRASACRPSGVWKDDDYDVLCESAVVGRPIAPSSSICYLTMPGT